jgi:arylsulfatase A-like enzyme
MTTHPVLLTWRIAAAVLLLLSAATCSAAQATSRPNVLFIAIDDLNDWVGCLGGHPQVQTPHMDSLASRGTLFTNAHCQSPLCNSSRTSLMLGLRPSTTGVYGLGPWFLNVPQLKDRVSLPRFFASQGYRTFYTGKIYHANYGRDPGSEFDVIGPPADAGPFPPKPLVRTPSKNPWVDWGQFPHRDEERGDYKVASWAVQQLAARHEEPFFLAVGFFLPHVPCFAPPKWFDLYPEQTLHLPEVRPNDRHDTPRFSWYLHWQLPEPRWKWLQGNNQWKNLVRSYLACTSFVDSQVGRVLTAVEENGLADNTIVVLWSDHGWHLGEKLITGKNSLWDRSTRVPLIFAGPGVAVGARCNRPVELLDIYPTLVELCGLPAKEGLEGQSIVPQLVDAATSRERPAITTHNPDNHGVRSEDWRYIRYADGSEELYDMTNDPGEFNNLAGQEEYHEVIAAHRRWMPSTSAPHAPGSHSRILTYENGEATWEGKRIPPDAPPP